jgi:hypothetical protein
VDELRAAFRDECARLEEVLRGLADPDLDRPTPCPPWQLRDLVAHVRPVPGGLGWDPLTTIRKVTGRADLTGRERDLVEAAGFGWLSFAG